MPKQFFQMQVQPDAPVRCVPGANIRWKQSKYYAPRNNLMNSMTAAGPGGLPVKCGYNTSQLLPSAKALLWPTGYIFHVSNDVAGYALQLEVDIPVTNRLFF
jgi:hypothetical protein